MSVSDTISRYSTAKTSIASAITAKGVTVPSGSGFEDFAALIRQISGGGGGGVSVASTTKTLTSAARSISFTGLSGQPTAFMIISNSNLATGASPYKVASVLYDGTSYISNIITNTSNAQSTFETGKYTHTYSNGTLSVNRSDTTANFQANTYSVFYAYGDILQTKDQTVGSGASSISFTGLTAEPQIIMLSFTGANFSTASGYSRVQSIAGINGSLRGMYMGSSSTASNNAWTSSYSNGTLTISSTSTTNYFHQVSGGKYHLAYA